MAFELIMFPVFVFVGKQWIIFLDSWRGSFSHSSDKNKLLENQGVVHSHSAIQVLD